MYQSIVRVMSPMSQVPVVKGPPHRMSGQGSMANPTAKSQSQWDGPWLGVPALPAPSQGTEQSRCQLGEFGISMGREMGQGLVQDCPVRASLGQGLRVPEVKKRSPGPGAGDNAVGYQVLFSLVMMKTNLSLDPTHIINPKLANMMSSSL